MFLIHTYHMHLTNPLTMLWFLLWYKAPDSSKRMFVLASLYGQLTRTDGFDKLLVRAVNRRMQLACRPQALQFPMAISRWLWGNVLPIQRTSLDDIDHYVSRLVKRTPCWLWYADAQTRHDDIRELVEWTSTHA